MEKLYYSIREEADILGEQVSLVRFWSNTFPKLLKPSRNGRGDRIYTASDIEVLRQIHYLVKGKGMTLEGAGRELSSRRSEVEARVRVLSSLRAIRAQLVEIKNSL